MEEKKEDDFNEDQEASDEGKEADVGEEVRGGREERRIPPTGWPRSKEVGMQ